MMDSIIQFIFDNIFWIIIAFIFLNGLGKSKKKRNQNVPPAQAPEAEVDAWREEDEEDDVFQPEARKGPTDKDLENMPKPLRDLLKKVDAWPVTQEKPYSPPTKPFVPRSEEVISYEGTGYGSSEGVSMEGPPIVLKAGSSTPAIEKGAAMVLAEVPVSPVLQRISRTLQDKNRVQEAVVWSEILGPPKSRRH